MTTVDNRAVGLCLGLDGATVVVIRPDPARLVAIATVAWPVGFGPSATVARRTLARTRSRLRLPRWHRISVVLGPSLSDRGGTAELLAGTAELLARCGLVQGWLITPQRAAGAAPSVAIPPAMRDVATVTATRLAIGAAAAALARTQPTSVKPRPVPATPARPTPSQRAPIQPTPAPAPAPAQPTHAQPIPAQPIPMPARAAPVQTTTIQPRPELVPQRLRGWALQHLGDIDELPALSHKG
jgi:hypothetical protein